VRALRSVDVPEHVESLSQLSPRRRRARPARGDSSRDSRRLVNRCDAKRKAKALAILAQTGSVERAAAAAGVGKRTVERWRVAKDPGIRAAEAVVENDDEVRRIMRAAAKDAAKLLHEQILAKEIKGSQLAVVMGILIDKARLLAAKDDDADDKGEVTVVVKRGGARVRVGEVTPAGVLAVEVQSGGGG
jgi:hypothetical protein